MSVPAPKGSNRWVLLLAALALPGLAGCGASKVIVTGKVYCNKKLVRGGDITFTSLEDQGSVSARIDEEGTYTLDKVPIGKVKISVDTERLNPRARRGSRFASQQKPPKDQGSESYRPSREDTSKFVYVPIPEKYRQPNTSNLVYTVEAKNQEYDVEIPPK
jgi:hypothetical protein